MPGQTHVTNRLRHNLTINNPAADNGLMIHRAARRLQLVFFFHLHFMHRGRTACRACVMTFPGHRCRHAHPSNEMHLKSCMPICTELPEAPAYAQAYAQNAHSGHTCACRPWHTNAYSHLFYCISMGGLCVGAVGLRNAIMQALHAVQLYT